MKKVLSLCYLVTTSACASLPAFGPDTQMAGQQVRAPYTSVVSYYGYVPPGAQPDEVVDGKNLFYLYVWLPAMAPEIGVRMISPTKRLMQPTSKDMVEANYMANKDSSDYFDTWVRLDRCGSAMAPDDVLMPCETWISMGENDDSNELPAQPNGDKHNSVLRLTSSTEDSMKTLDRGMYRVAMTTQKMSDVKGTFLLQIGTPVDIPGIAIARTPADLYKMVTVEPMPATSSLK